MTERRPTNEEPAAPLVRLRPRHSCGAFAEYLWRCFCYVGDPPRVCDCEAHGVWMCMECVEEVTAHVVVAK